MFYGILIVDPFTCKNNINGINAIAPNVHFDQLVFLSNAQDQNIKKFKIQYKL